MTRWWFRVRHDEKGGGKNVECICKCARRRRAGLHRQVKQCTYSEHKFQCVLSEKRAFYLLLPDTRLLCEEFNLVNCQFITLSLTQTVQVVRLLGSVCIIKQKTAEYKVKGASKKLISYLFECTNTLSTLSFITGLVLQ